MKHLSILLLALCVVPVAVFARFKRITLVEAIASHEVTLAAVNVSGSFQGKTTKVVLTNQSKQALGVVVELGTILKPADSINQPMILAKEEYVMLSPLPASRSRS